MSKLITLVAIIFVTTILQAQQNMYENITDSYELLHKKTFNENHGKILKEVQTQKLFAVNFTDGMIWVQDSAYYFSDYGADWTLTNRDKVLLRDVHGNMASAISQFYNATSETWTNKDTITATYHNASAQYKHMKKGWNSYMQQWADTNSYREYDENGNALVIFEHSWDYLNNVFGYGHKYYTTLNEEGFALYYTSYQWNSNTQQWFLSEQGNYTYDADGKLTQLIIQNWNSSTDEWENSSKYLYSYDANGNQTQELSQNWDINTEEWMNSTKNLDSYDANGNQTQRIGQIWNNDNNEWVDSWKALYSYDANGNRTQQLWQRWNPDTDEWDNSAKFSYSYNANGNITHYLYQYWNFNTGELMGSSKTFYSFDANGNRTQKLSQDWDINTEEWVNTNRTDYYWSEFETSGITGINENSIKIYPNPATYKITIPTEYFGTDCLIQIHSLSGKIMKTGRLNANNEFDISNLPSGVYFVDINGNKGHFVTKIIKN